MTSVLLALRIGPAYKIGMLNVVVGESFGCDLSVYAAVAQQIPQTLRQIRMIENRSEVGSKQWVLFKCWR